MKPATRKCGQLGSQGLRMVRRTSAFVAAPRDVLARSRVLGTDGVKWRQVARLTNADSFCAGFISSGFYQPMKLHNRNVKWQFHGLCLMYSFVRRVEESAGSGLIIELPRSWLMQFFQF